jgi:hypothetical protein
MNRTKWRELAAEMTSNPEFNPRVRVKYLIDTESENGFAHQDWEWVKFGESRVIERMDISPLKLTHIGHLVDDQMEDFSSWVRTALQKHSIPFSEEEGLFVIRAYLKSNDK